MKCSPCHFHIIVTWSTRFSHFFYNDKFFCHLAALKRHLVCLIVIITSYAPEKYSVGRISPKSWETIASDRSAWRTSCTEALQEGEKLLHITVNARREQQKDRALPTPTNSTYVCRSGRCIRQSRILDSKATLENV